MLTKLRPHLSYANVMASVAVFIALGGTSVGAVSLKKNSVGSKQIKAEAVKGAELADNAVTSRKVKDRSLLAKDFRAGQLPAGPRGPAGFQGATGARGTTGAPGTPGTPGTSVAYATIDDTGSVVAGTAKNITSSNIDADTVTGAVCFTGLSFTPRSMVASPYFDGATGDVITSTYPRTTDFGNCDGTAMVRTYDASSAAFVNYGFTVWFDG